MNCLAAVDDKVKILLHFLIALRFFMDKQKKKHSERRGRQNILRYKNVIMNIFSVDYLIIYKERSKE